MVEEAKKVGLQIDLQHRRWRHADGRHGKTEPFTIEAGAAPNGNGGDAPSAVANGGGGGAGRQGELDDKALAMALSNLVQLQRNGDQLEVNKMVSAAATLGVTIDLLGRWRTSDGRRARSTPSPSRPAAATAAGAAPAGGGGGGGGGGGAEVLSEEQIAKQWCTRCRWPATRRRRGQMVDSLSSKLGLTIDLASKQRTSDGVGTRAFAVHTADGPAAAAAWRAAALGGTMSDLEIRQLVTKLHALSPTWRRPVRAVLEEAEGRPADRPAEPPLARGRRAGWRDRALHRGDGCGAATANGGGGGGGPADDNPACRRRGRRWRRCRWRR